MIHNSTTKHGTLVLLLLILCTTVGDAFAQVSITKDTSGLNYGLRELKLWRQRANYGPYKTSGDIAGNSPGDWDRIKEYADSIRKKPIVVGPNVAGQVDSNKFSVWAGYRTTTELPESYIVVWQGIKLMSAGLYALVKLDSALADSVKKALLYQATMANAQSSRREATIQYLDVQNGPSAGRNPITEGSGTLEAVWIVRLMRAYDYTKTRFSSAEKTTMTNFFLGWARQYRREIHDGLSGDFPHRLSTGSDTNTYSYRAAPLGTNDSSGQYHSHSIYAANDKPLVKTGASGYLHTHIDKNGNYKNPISKVSMSFNNRKVIKVHMFGLIGILCNNDTLINHAKLYFKEHLKFGTYPDGTISEYERNGGSGGSDIYGNSPAQGMWYGAMSLDAFIDLADALLRNRNDASIYVYKTSQGVHGTQDASGTQPKSLKSIIYRYCYNMTGQDSIFWFQKTHSKRISHVQLNDPTSPQKEAIWDQYFAIANRYYNDPLIRACYTRQNLAAAQRTTAAWGVGVCYGGASFTQPGTLFMYSRMEGPGYAYNAAGRCDGRTDSSWVFNIEDVKAVLRFRRVDSAKKGYLVLVTDSASGRTLFKDSTSASALDTTKVLTGLTPSTRYRAYVQTKCNNNSVGDLSQGVSFLTLPWRSKVVLVMTSTGVERYLNAIDTITVSSLSDTLFTIRYDTITYAQSLSNPISKVEIHLDTSYHQLTWRKDDTAFPYVLSTSSGSNPSYTYTPSSPRLVQGWHKISVRPFAPGNVRGKTHNRVLLVDYLSEPNTQHFNVLNARTNKFRQVLNNNDTIFLTLPADTALAIQYDSLSATIDQDIEQVDFVLDSGTVGVRSSSTGNYPYVFPGKLTRYENNAYRYPSIDYTACSPKLTQGWHKLFARPKNNASQYGKKLKVNFYVKYVSGSRLEGGNSGFVVYPNPARSRLTAIVPSERVAKVWITSAEGRRFEVACTRQSDQMDIDIRHLSPGIYTLSVALTSGEITKTRFAKE